MYLPNHTYLTTGNLACFWFVLFKFDLDVYLLSILQFLCSFQFSIIIITISLFFFFNLACVMTSTYVWRLTKHCSQSNMTMHQWCCPSPHVCHRDNFWHWRYISGTITDLLSQNFWSPLNYFLYVKCLYVSPAYVKHPRHINYIVKNYQCVKNDTMTDLES